MMPARTWHGACGWQGACMQKLGPNLLRCLIILDVSSFLARTEESSCGRVAGASDGVAVNCASKTSDLADVLAQEEAELRGLVRLSQQRIETLEELLAMAATTTKEPEDSQKAAVAAAATAAEAAPQPLEGASP